MSSDRSPGLPDGSLGMAGAIVACAAGATLAIEVGLDPVASLVVAVGVAIASVFTIKIGMDMRTARLVKAIADGDLEPEAAPGGIQDRLASNRHRSMLARALRKVAVEARRYPWQGRLAAPPMVLHFQPETCERLVHLAEVLESSDELTPRGVAMVEDLVTNPLSPLFGQSDDEVEIEVRRVLFTLGSD